MSSVQTIGIIGGNGRMGQRLAAEFRALGYRILICDRGTKLGTAELTRQADVICISVPIAAGGAVAAEVLPELRAEEQLVFGVFSTAAPLLAAFAPATARGISVLNAHPMCDPDNWSTAQTVIFSTPTNDWAEVPSLLREQLFCSWQQRLVGSTQHDNGMALVQAVQHFSTLLLGAHWAAIGQSLGETGARPQAALVGRLLSQNPELYSNILFQSDTAQAALAAFTGHLQRLGNSDQLAADWRDAHERFRDFPLTLTLPKTARLQPLLALAMVQTMRDLALTPQGLAELSSPVYHLQLELLAQTFSDDLPPRGFATDFSTQAEEIIAGGAAELERVFTATRSVMGTAECTAASRVIDGLIVTS